MAKRDEDYRHIVVESFRASLPGHLGNVLVRPIPEEGYRLGMLVECLRAMRKYPVGTRFRIRAKLTDREGEGEYLYTSYRWPYQVLA